MVATPEQIKDLEDFFASIAVPKTIKLHGSITYTNLPQTIADTVAHLKAGVMPEIILRPRYGDLLDIRKVLENKTA